jgi:hypothetical protein
MPLSSLVCGLPRAVAPMPLACVGTFMCSCTPTRYLYETRNVFQTNKFFEIRRQSRKLHIAIARGNHRFIMSVRDISSLS